METKILDKKDVTIFVTVEEDLEPEIVECVKPTSWKVRKYKKIFPYFEKIEVEGNTLKVTSKPINDEQLDIIKLIIIQKMIEKAVKMYIHLEVGYIALNEISNNITKLLDYEGEESNS